MATPTTKYRDLLALFDNVKAGDVAGDPERFAEALVTSRLPDGARVPRVLLAHPNELRRLLARVFEAGRASMITPTHNVDEKGGSK